jgi:hypothetical protein
MSDCVLVRAQVTVTDALRAHPVSLPCGCVGAVLSTSDRADGDWGGMSFYWTLNDTLAAVIAGGGSLLGLYLGQIAEKLFARR